MYLDELNRCLGCKKPRCSQGCPAKTPIYDIFNCLKNGLEEEAGRLFFENNPLSYLCSLVCDHAKQCYGNCVLNAKGNPIKVYEIEQEVSKKYLDMLKLNKPVPNGKKVAIVGAGPAGITASIKLALKGVSVTLFEANEKIGGVLQYGIPAFRLDRSIIKKYEDILRSLDVKIRYNTLIGQTLTLDVLQKEYDAIILTVGLQKASSLKLEGEGLSTTYYAIDYLKNADSIKLGDKVVVIGAGNVAMDAARSAKHYGSKEVYVFYRADESRMKATKKEIQEAKDEGVIFKLCARPIKIIEGNFIYRNTEQLEDKSIRDLDEVDHAFSCSNVIIATGQETRMDFNSENLKYNKYRLLEVDENYMTSLENVYACGDIVSGAKTVVEAMDMAKKCVACLCDKLQID